MFFVHSDLLIGILKLPFCSLWVISNLLSVLLYGYEATAPTLLRSWLNLTLSICSVSFTLMLFSSRRSCSFLRYNCWKYLSLNHMLLYLPCELAVCCLSSIVINGWSYYFYSCRPTSIVLLSSDTGLFLLMVSVWRLTFSYWYRSPPEDIRV